MGPRPFQSFQGFQLGKVLSWEDHQAWASTKAATERFCQLKPADGCRLGLRDGSSLRSIQLTFFVKQTAFQSNHKNKPWWSICVWFWGCVFVFGDCWIVIDRERTSVPWFKWLFSSSDWSPSNSGDQYSKTQPVTVWTRMVYEPTSILLNILKPPSQRTRNKPENNPERKKNLQKGRNELKWKEPSDQEKKLLRHKSGPCG